MDFNNELLNYAVYKQQSEKNKGIRETILQRLLLTNSPEYFDIASKQQVSKEEIEDPEGIMKTWEDANPKEVKELKEKETEKC